MHPINTISVAMCTYNGEAFLKEQLDSIQAQNFPPSELVICDDCSQDATLEIIYAFKASCNFHINVLVNERTVGVSKNFENAIAHCSGDVILLADQDDIWLPTKIQEIVNVFQDCPECGYVFSDAELINEDGISLGCNLWELIKFEQKRHKKYTGGEQLEVMLKGGHFVYGMAMAFRSSFKSILIPIDSSRFTARQGMHDTWISLLLSAIGAYGVPIHHPLVKYRQHEKQISRGNRRNFSLKLRAFDKATGLAFAGALDVIAKRVDDAIQRGEYASNSGSTKILGEKAWHLRARSLANSIPRLKRWKIIFSEAFSGRYRKYSGSYKSIIKDMIVGCSNNKLV